MELDNLIKFWPYALLGLFISLCFDVYSSGIKLDQIDFKKWANDGNLLRVIISILCLFTALMFSEDILGVTLTPLTAFWGGIGNDNIVNMFMRRRQNINKKSEEDANNSL